MMNRAHMKSIDARTKMTLTTRVRRLSIRNAFAPRFFSEVNSEISSVSDALNQIHTTPWTYLF